MKMIRLLMFCSSGITLVSLLCSFADPTTSMQGFFPILTASTHDMPPEQVCLVAERELTEASGLAISRRRDNAVWVHNDSGDTARLFLIQLDGKTRAVVTLKDTEPRDWEDMCSFQIDGEKWLLIADTGDNGRVRGESGAPCELLLLKEPVLNAELAASDEIVKATTDVFARITVDYPEGPADCESVAVDTERREILLLTKTDPLNCRLFRLPLSMKPGRQSFRLEQIGSLAVPYATAMDISEDGKQLAIVNMFSGALLKRAESESWSEACGKPAIVLTLPTQPQGETVCFEKGGKSLLLNSERRGQPLWRVKLPQSP